MIEQLGGDVRNFVVLDEENGQDSRDTNDTSTVTPDGEISPEIVERGLEALGNTKTRWYAYLAARDFWLVLALGLLVDDGWKYAILSFLDVEGNYFTVLAYRYTNLLSAQLVNFWAIVCVVIVSFTFLRVRYKPAQIIGIFICCSGMGILLVSDHITGTNGGDPPTKIKGDLFGLVGATFYGLSNVFEEWFVSKRPIYEVLGMLGLFGALINGLTAAIFDRHSFAIAVWNVEIAGYIAGFTFSLTTFYSLAPLILRMASAVFFDISLLTSNFWGVIIGLRLFGFTIYYLYPIAFVLIIIGLVVYFLTDGILGESRKPWLGKYQEQGVVGIGTAKKKAIKEAQKDD
ncbi:hypothetical protein EPUL_004613, partial [Erysiphe pulchra]